MGALCRRVTLAEPIARRVLSTELNRPATSVYSPAIMIARYPKSRKEHLRRLII